MRVPSVAVKLSSPVLSGTSTLLLPSSGLTSGVAVAVATGGDKVTTAVGDGVAVGGIGVGVNVGPPGVTVGPWVGVAVGVGVKVGLGVGVAVATPLTTNVPVALLLSNATSWLRLAAVNSA